VDRHERGDTHCYDSGGDHGTSGTDSGLETRSSKHDHSSETDRLPPPELVTDESGSEGAGATSDFVNCNDRSEKAIGRLLECGLEARTVDDSTEDTVVISDEQEPSGSEAWRSDGWSSWLRDL
jgi:hypothetical protein